MNNKILFYDYKEYFSSPETQLDFHLWHNLETTYHSHNYYEIFLVTKGSCEHIYNANKYELNKGNLVLIPPDVPHKLINVQNTGFSLINISVTKDLMEQLALSFPENFLEDIRYDPTIKKIALDSVTYDFLHHLVYNKIIPAMHINYISALKFWILSALSIIDMNNARLTENSFPAWFKDIIQSISLKENLSKKLFEISAVAHYSPTTLSKYFKQYLKTTPNNYFIGLKMKYACQLLQKTDYSTFVISEKVGYDSLSHFNRIFKKMMGKTPSEYRKKYAKMH